MPIRSVLLFTSLFFLPAALLAQSRAVALNDSGVVQHQSGKIQEAVTLYTQALKLDENYALAYFNRGLAFNELSASEAAIKDFTKALQLKPDLAEAYFNRGLAYFSRHENSLAAIDMDTYLSKREDAEAYLIRGNIRFELRRFADAKADYIKYTLLQPADPAGWMALGDADHMLENTEQALESYTKAVNLQPSEKTARLQRARVYYDLGRYGDAEADYSHLISLEKDTLELAMLYFERGDARQSLSRFRDAIDDYSLAIINYPLHSDAYFQRSACYLLLKEYRSALADINNYLKFNPEDKAEAIYNRGVLLYNLGSKKEACEDWKTSQAGGYPAAAKMLADYCK